MEYLLLALGGLALWHFVVDGILSADHQLLTRAQVANTGAALDRLRAERARELDLRAFNVVRESLSVLVRHPGAFTLWTFARSRRSVEADGELQRQIGERAQIVSSITDPELKAFADRVPEFAQRMLTCNSLGWMIFGVPIALALGMYRKTRATLAALVNMPEPQLAKIDRGPQTTIDKWFR
jgi:hypothetical protein